MQIFSFSPFGYEGALVTVEVDIRRGIPAVDIVGLADGAVKESRERMRAAVKNSGFAFPSERVLISLSPADLRKEGAGFDLAIALTVLQAEGATACAVRKNNALQDEAAAYKTESNMSYNKADERHGTLFSADAILVMGELELSGNVRSVRAVHAAAATAASSGILKCIVPRANADEAREVDGMKVYGADTLEGAFDALTHPEYFTERGESLEHAFVPDGATEVDGVLFPPATDCDEFAEIIRQKFLVRGLQIAAAGGHNVLAVGAPGCGKTMALQKFGALLPLLTVEEAQSITRIYSVAGLMNRDEPLVRIAPFRQPHQTATIEGMCGGGIHCIPGEISLAHNGVLFLDEAAEFRTSVLQMLRVPVETGRITLARAGRSTVYPASFQLLLATNPCPCGNFGSKSKVCLCSARAVELYWNKFSAPLLDRIDIRIPVNNEYAQNALQHAASAHCIDIDAAARQKTSDTQSGTVSTAELRRAIARAIKTERRRQGCRNARLMPQEVVEHCRTTKEARTLLDNAVLRYGFSARAVSSCLKIARTIADMDDSDLIQDMHIKEAVSYRKPCNDFMNSSATGE
ncbi:MAG: ATP-binding protein [Treponema sp.]|nr:ATP-binding protein [Treponema sp.]